MRRVIMALAVIALFAASSGQVRADIATFDFANSPLGASTPFSLTDNGVTATFSSPNDPGAFSVTNSIFSPSFPSYVLLDPGPANADQIPLDIAFSRQIQSISMKFALNDPINTTTLDLAASNGGTPAGSTSASGSIPSGFGFPEGTLSFSGLFDKVQLTTGALDFAVADIVVTFSSVAVPEPSSFLLAGMLGLGLGAGALWRHRKSA